MTEIVDAYIRTRERMAQLAVGAMPLELTRTVAACPEWAVKDLIGHVVSLPAAISTGRLPKDDLAGWLASLVTERADQPVSDLVAEWRALDGVLPGLLDGGGSALFADLAIHEHDLRAALARPDHAALEVDVILPCALAAFSQPLQEAGLGAIEVRCGARSWQSHAGPMGWSLLVDPWEAVRALSSRRTADELMALPAAGNAAPYLNLLDAHLPLPGVSLGEA